MPKLIKKISKTSGLAPGTLVHVGEAKTEKVKIHVIDYDEKKIQEKEAETPEECYTFKDTPTVSWINIDGIHNLDIIEKLGKHFDFHPLMLEDIVNTGQRPKYEDFDNYIFVVLKMLSYDEKEQGVKPEQIGLILGKNYVISFQETEGDIFNPIRERIRNAKGRIRTMGADYLAYSLFDAIVDNYFIILEKFVEKIESMEDELLNYPSLKTLQAINGLKSNAIFMRKAVWPLREVIGGLQRTESGLIRKTTGVFLRDVYDHTIQVIDTIETLRDMISGKLDIYLSSISNKMNEVMKVLTIIATIFIPITFIAGIYGMNFNPEVSPFNMPELNWRYGYFAAGGAMCIVVLIMVVYFKRKRWF